MINWTHVVRRHRDFLTHTLACDSPANEISVMLRDGCGSANFHGPDSWEEAARHLGFEVRDIDEVGGVE